MRFFIPINEANDGESQTVHIVDTESDCARTNKRKLKEYFEAVGVPVPRIKKVMKAMGFWGSNLGVQNGTKH